MILLFKFILITTIWCVGVMICTADGMIMYKIRVYAKNKIDSGAKHYEALVYCPWCLPSVHSIVGYLFSILLGIVSKFEWSIFFMYPLVVMGSSLLTGIIWSIHNLIDAKTQYYLNAEKLAYFEIRDRKNKYHEKSNHRQQASS